MQWRPWEVYRCTVNEFEASYNGWFTANCAPAENADPITRGELDDLQALAARYEALDG